MLGEGLLRKRYDYYFTGLNTEVLRFDINLDATYFRLKPIRDGHVGSTQANKGAIFDMIKNADPRGEDASQPFDPTKDYIQYAARPTPLKVPESATTNLDAETARNIRNSNNF